MKSCVIKLHINDIPKKYIPSDVVSVSIDTEATGLLLSRDRLCLVQLRINDSQECHLIQISQNAEPAPVLTSLLLNPKILKIFHYARFDIAMLYKTFRVTTKNIFCTKIASKLCRTYTESHSLKSVCRELLSVSISKEQTSTDWASTSLSDAQKSYAASDVIYLLDLKVRLESLLIREGRYDLALSCFNFIMSRVHLDLAGWVDTDIFSHI